MARAIPARPTLAPKPSSLDSELAFCIRQLTGLSSPGRAPEKVFGAPYDKGSVGVEVNPALLGVGYVIGPRIASIVCWRVLAYLV